MDDYEGKCGSVTEPDSGDQEGKIYLEGMNIFVALT